MKTRNCLIAGLIAAGLCVKSLALACDDMQIPTPEPANYFVFGDPSPAPGSTGVPLDSVLILRGRGYGIGGSPVVFSAFLIGTLQVTDVAGRAVPVHAAMTDLSVFQPTTSWTFDRPLLPNTQYHVSASLSPQRFAREPEMEGAETIEFDFTTGTERVPALELSGNIRVEYERQVFHIKQCSNNCAEGCHEVGQRAALMAKVTLPTAHGGSDVEGYSAGLMLSDRAPVTFDGPGGSKDDQGHEVWRLDTFRLPRDTPQTVNIELPDKDHAYVPCFSVNIWDPAGRSVAATPVCLDPVDPGDVVGESVDAGGPDAQTSTPADAAPVLEPRADARNGETRPESSGCSMGAAVSPSAGWLALALAGLSARARRRGGTRR